jgi:hypothetical protein
MINCKPRGAASEEDERMRLFCTLRHFPELRRSLAASAALNLKEVTQPPEDKVAKKVKMTPEMKAVEESRKVTAKFRDLRSSVLVEVDNQYADLKCYLREHRDRYREERRCHLRLLESATGTRSGAGSDLRVFIEPTALETACDKLATAGIYIDASTAQSSGRCDEKVLQSEVRQCGLRQVLDLPPYVALPDSGPVEMSSQPCKLPNGPSWKKPSPEQEFRQYMRQRLEVVLCVRLSDEELLAVFNALYTPPTVT